MPRTFEELAGEELDALYQGALFLSGGSEPRAERLLIDTITLAFEEHAGERDVTTVQRWLEAGLVRSFLKSVSGFSVSPVGGLGRRATLDPATFEDIGSEELFTAAASLPVWPRAALWLVLLRRWTYADAAAVMEVDPSVIPSLLAYRDVLIRSMLAPARGGKRYGAGS